MSILNTNKNHNRVRFMEYDAWKTGYYEDCQTSSRCIECNDILQKFDQASEFIEGIKDQLYGRKTFDREVLDHCVSELCWLLNVKEPEEEIAVFKVKDKQDKIFNFALNIARELNPKIN